HRAVGGDGHRLPARRRRIGGRRGRRLAGDPGLRHGSSERVARGRRRSRDLAGLRLRHGDRSHRDAEIRHSRPAHLLRGRPPVAASLRLRGAGRADQLWRVVAMKFTLTWLKEHLATEASLAEIVDKLTMLGLEVEEVTTRGAY